VLFVTLYALELNILSAGGKELIFAKIVELQDTAALCRVLSSPNAFLKPGH